MKFRGGVQSDNVGALGIQYNSHVRKSVVIELATDNATTSVADAFPAFSRLVAVCAKVTTAIAGADATGFNLQMNGKTVATGADLAVHPATGGAIAWNLDTDGDSVQTTGSAGTIAVTLTGGSDQIPTAGVITVEFVYENWA